MSSRVLRQEYEVTRCLTQNTQEEALKQYAVKQLLPPIQRQTTLNDLRQEFEDFSAKVQMVFSQ